MMISTNLPSNHLAILLSTSLVKQIILPNAETGSPAHASSKALLHYLQQPSPQGFKCLITETATLESRKSVE